MSFIQSISNKSAGFLANKVPNTDYPTVADQVEVYDYGFQVIYSSIIKGAIVLGLAWLFGVLLPTLIVIVTFSSFRVLAGGYHAGTYLRCLIMSGCMFLTGGLLVKYTLPLWSEYGLIALYGLSTLYGLYIILKYVPKDTPNKPINNIKDQNRLKKQSLLYLLFWCLLIGVCIINNIYFVVLSSCIGLLLEMFLVSKVGYMLSEKIFSVR